MICLDTNYLILGLVSDSQESRQLTRWEQSGETLVTAMPAWYEFLCGPVTQAQITVIRSFLREIIPFGEAQAMAAALLFNSVQRQRSLRVDALIAGTAIAAGATLATNNRSDFEVFVPFGLILVRPR